MTNQKIALISLTGTSYKTLGEMANDLQAGHSGLEQRLNDLYQITKNNKFDLKDDYEAKIRVVLTNLNDFKTTTLANTNNEILSKIDAVKQHFSTLFASLNSTVSTLQAESENRLQSANQEISKHFREISQEISALNLKIVQETVESQQQTTKALENRINKLMYDQANLINETKEKFDVVIEEYNNKINNMHKDVDKLSNEISTQKLDENRLKEDIIKATIENAKDEIQLLIQQNTNRISRIQTIKPKKKPNYKLSMRVDKIVSLIPFMNK